MLEMSENNSYKLKASVLTDSLILSANNTFKFSFVCYTKLTNGTTQLYNFGEL